MKLEDMPENRCEDHKTTELADTCFYCEELYNEAVKAAAKKAGVSEETAAIQCDLWEMPEENSSPEEILSCMETEFTDE